MHRPIHDIEKLATIARDTGISSDYDNMRPVHYPIVTRTNNGKNITPWHVEHTAKAFRAIYRAEFTAEENRAGMRLAAHSVALEYQIKYTYDDMGASFDIRAFLVACGFTDEDLKFYSL